MKKILNALIIILFMSIIFPAKLFAYGSVDVSAEQLNMYEGDTKTFTIEAVNSVGKIDIESSDPSIVTVSEDSCWLDNDVLTVTTNGVKKGKASITISYTDVASYDKEEIKGSHIIDVSVNEKIEYFAKNNLEMPTDAKDVISKFDISGQYVSNDQNSRIEIYIDGKYIPYSQDTIVKSKNVNDDGTITVSYGVEVSTLEKGRHTVAVWIISSENKLLVADTRDVNVKEYVARTYIDNPKPNSTQNVQMQIDGWVLSDDENARVEVYIDGKYIGKNVERVARAGLIESVTGYGTAEQNPTPEYIVNVDLSDLKDGEHTVSVWIVSSDNKLLATDTKTFNLKKYVARTYIDNPKQNANSKEHFQIDGWVLSNDKDARVEVYIDGKYIGKSVERTPRAGLIESVTGYGTAEQNPTPKYIVDVNIPGNGKHTISVWIVSSNNELLASDTRTVNVEGYVARTYIDNPKPNSTQRLNMQIDGWMLSDDKNARVEVYVDGKYIGKSVERKPRAGLIESVTGYGTAEQNPNPQFVTNVDLSGLRDGEHTVSVWIVSSNNKLLATDTKTFNLQKYVARTYIDNPKVNRTVKTSMQIDGWVLSDDKDARVEVYIDGKYIGKSVERTPRAGLIESVTGYGTAEQNPNPQFITNVDLSNLRDGEHTVAVWIISSANELLAVDTRKINLHKYDGTIHIEKPIDNNLAKNQITLVGWEMSETPDTSIITYMDDSRVGNTINRIKRQDVINAIPGYGGIGTNPTPGFSGVVDVKYVSEGMHVLKVQVISSLGDVISEKKILINVYKDRYWGIDVSSYQQNINWNDVKDAGVEFAIIRCGYRGYGTGKIVEDTYYRKNITKVNELGIPCGVYFFSQAINVDEAVEEANWVLNQVRGYTVQYPIIIDTEYVHDLETPPRANSLSTIDRTRVCVAFCDTIRNAGYTPMIYASKNWYINNLDMSYLNTYDIWLAHYTEKTDYKGKYNMWQYTSTGKVNGITGNVDMNYLYKSYK